ncbi:MAG: 50S ribosomal protein L29 [Candidatus Woesearchaeota archaeon]|nr:50S ribosomal protein L29 [Candidatus Woesearchaeota archaeon]
MKFKELKLMSEADLKEKSNEIRKELMKLNSQVAMGTIIKNPGQIKGIKKTIARIKTILKTKEVKK